MTRRIVIAILLACWAVVVTGGVVAYVVTRTVLLDDLDAQIFARALLIPEVAGESADVTSTYPNDRYLIENDRGRTVARLPEGAQSAALTIAERRFAVLADGRRVRSLVLKGHPSRSNATSQPVAPMTIVYSSSSERFDRITSRLAGALVATGALAGLASAGAAVMVARTALRPLLATAETLSRIDEASLNQRLDASKLPPELAPVAGRLNEMLSRLERSSMQRKRFLADAAHELRTPVAALLMTLEVTTRRQRDATAMAASLARCLVDARRLTALVEGLMAHARSESPATAEPVREADLVPILTRCADMAARLGEPRGVTVSCHIADRLLARLPVGRFESVVQNLLSNAVEYNRDGGHVDLRCDRQPNGLLLSVSDDGPGISAEVLPNLFEPFVRGQASDRPDNGHLGLGLASVQANVTAMGGQIDVTSSANAGTVFRIAIPQAVERPVDRVDQTVTVGT